MLKTVDPQQKGTPPRADDEQLANAGDCYRAQARSGGEPSHAVGKHKADDAIVLEGVNLQQKGTQTGIDDEQLPAAGDGYLTQPRSGCEFSHAVEEHMAILLHAAKLPQKGTPFEADDEPLAAAGNGYPTEAKDGGELSHAIGKHKADDAIVLKTGEPAPERIPTDR